MPISNRGFDRVATALLGAGVGQYAVLIEIDNPPAKKLTDIYVSVSETDFSVAANVSQKYVVRVGVFSQQGLFPNLPTILNYNPLASPNQDAIGDVGQIYFDHSIYLPENQQIHFAEPMYFNNGDRIYIAASFSYTDSDTLLNPASRVVRLSARGEFITSNITQYKYR